MLANWVIGRALFFSLKSEAFKLVHLKCILSHLKIYRGASISVSNAAGNTPLMTAIISGNLDVLLHMLKAINEAEKMSFRDILSLNAKNNKSVLTWAIESNHTVLIEVRT